MGCGAAIASEHYSPITTLVSGACRARSAIHAPPGWTSDDPGLSHVASRHYLRLEPLRREIHEGLQAIEHWNSANDFILYGKGGEFASNRIEDQELAMLSLHLLQVSLVYINTLMIQQVLAEPAWQDRVTVADLRALTPLLWAHVYPYGTFTLNMRERLPLAQGSVTAEATWPKFRPSLPRGLWAKRGWEGSAGQCWPRP